MLIRKLLKRLRGKDKSKDTEKRAYARLVYPSMRRPKLKIKASEMDVIDISEKGVKFIKDKHQALSECVHGTTVLLSGKSIDIAGKIVWKRNNEVGLLIAQIKESVIIDEIRTVLREMGSRESDDEK
jgi:hypothetical protein